MFKFFLPGLAAEVKQHPVSATKLVPTMLRAEVPGKLKSPKLRASVGETRDLIPGQLLIAKKFLDMGSTVEATMVQANEQLNNWYECLSAR